MSSKYCSCCAQKRPLLSFLKDTLASPDSRVFATCINKSSNKKRAALQSLHPNIPLTGIATHVRPPKRVCRLNTGPQPIAQAPLPRNLPVEPPPPNPQAPVTVLPLPNPPIEPRPPQAPVTVLPLPNPPTEPQPPRALRLNRNLLKPQLRAYLQPNLRASYPRTNGGGYKTLIELWRLCRWRPASAVKSVDFPWT
jgi:hypothetical protein